MVKILHVEDDPRQSDLIRVLLAKDGHTVLSVQDPFEVVSIAKAELPSLIFADINMPRMNGVELARIIKDTPELAKIPLVALTANSMSGDRDYYLSQKFDAYLPKPIMRFELTALIKQLLAK
jgi:CheY-like chemotaxis protein